MNYMVRALGIGFVAGLRSMTAPAVVANAAHAGRLRLRSTPARFMKSKRAAQVFSAFALMEYVADLLPNTPSRTELPGLVTRAVTGGFAGYCVAVSERENATAGVALGASAAIAGAFAGYYARTGLTKCLSTPDYQVAIPEDMLAIGLGSFFAFRR